MTTAIDYRIRQAVPADVPACLDFWLRKEQTFAAAAGERRLDGHRGRTLVTEWIEQGVMYVITAPAGDVVACCALTGDSTDFWTPVEAVLAAVSAHRPTAPPLRRPAELGPLARAMREIAETEDDLATARGLAADDDTFAVEADMLALRLPQLEARLAELRRMVGDDTPSPASGWEEAADLVAEIGVRQPPGGEDDSQTVVDRAVAALRARGQEVRQATGKHRRTGEE